VEKQFISSRWLGERGIGAEGVISHNLIAEWPQIIKENIHFNPLLKARSHVFPGVPIFTIGERFFCGIAVWPRSPHRYLNSMCGLYIVIIFLRYWGLNSGLLLARQALYNLSHPSGIFALVVF
jgi:hypothetical protein